MDPRTPKSTLIRCAQALENQVPQLIMATSFCILVLFISGKC